jgi:hypothetical protein
MSKVLVIPGSFVPYNDTVTLLTYKHLRLLDNEYDVVALFNKEDKSILDNVTNDDNYKKFNIMYVGNYNDVIMNMNNKNVFKGTINMFKYINKCVKQAELKKYDVIYSSSIPSFTHLAAYRIKKRYPKIKWVASFSDPIFKSPYKKDPDTFKDYSLLEKIGFYVYIFIYMNSSFEKMAMKHADEVIMISDAQKEFMCSNYDEDYRNKSHVVPLNYIKGWNIYKDLLSASHIKNDKLIAIHLGRLYGLRKIENFLIALSEIKEKVEGLIEFHQYGEIQPRYIKMINSLDLGKIFIIKKTVNYNSALTKLEEADVLLLFDTIMEGDNQPYLPSKII